MADKTVYVQSGSKGLGLGAIVFVILLILKLAVPACASITWFWVFFPLWIVPAVVIGIFLAILIIGGLIAGLVALFSR